MNVQGYRKKTKKELLDAIDKCVTITQLFSLVQHEGIVIQMRCSNGGQASNIPSKKLKTDEEVMLESPVDKMKREIKDIVKGQFFNEIDSAKNISELFAIIHREGINIPMRCSNGGQASNIPSKVLKTDEEVMLESPVEKMKREIKEMLC